MEIGDDAIDERYEPKGRYGGGYVCFDAAVVVRFSARLEHR